jgi:DNA-binding MarR family transcriptional regulator
MTDFSKYKNVTVDNDTYATITKMQTKLKKDIKLSRSQVVKIFLKLELKNLITFVILQE